MAHSRFRLQSRFNNRPLLVDVVAKPHFRFQPLVIFAHGMNGFMDWGPFPAMAERFADAGFAFCRFNFSHNGTTPEKPADFEDLEAYQTNTISIELADLDEVLTFFAGGKSASEGALIDKRRIGLMGHSRGGSVSLLTASQQPVVKALVTLSAPAAFDRSWVEDELAEWQALGVRHVPNRRTGQLMPMGYNLVADLHENANRFDLRQAASGFTKPWLIVHGEADETVPVADALEFTILQSEAQSLLLQDEGHTFGARHPYEPPLASGFHQASEAALRFFKAHL